MEPREPDLKQIPQPRPEEKKRRFRIVKLEDRIAPRNGGGINGGNNGTNHCPVVSGIGCCSLSVE